MIRPINFRCPEFYDDPVVYLSDWSDEIMAVTSETKDINKWGYNFEKKIPFSENVTGALYWKTTRSRTFQNNKGLISQEIANNEIFIHYTFT